MWEQGPSPLVIVGELSCPLVASENVIEIDVVHDLDALATAILHNSPVQQVAVASAQDTCHDLNLIVGQSMKPR